MFRFIDTHVDFLEQTTLLNHILTADHGKRIAVIENEVRFELCYLSAYVGQFLIAFTRDDCYWFWASVYLYDLVRILL